MKLIDVKWTPTVNRLTVECCGKQFFRPSNYSLVQCPECGKLEYWHGPFPLWDEKLQVMENTVK